MRNGVDWNNDQRKNAKNRVTSKPQFALKVIEEKIKMLRRDWEQYYGRTKSEEVNRRMNPVDEAWRNAKEYNFIP